MRKKASAPMYLKCDLRCARRQMPPLDLEGCQLAASAPGPTLTPNLLTPFREFRLSPENLGTKFDVILIDPPWDEYAQRKISMARGFAAFTGRLRSALRATCACTFFWSISGSCTTIHSSTSHWC